MPEMLTRLRVNLKLTPVLRDEKFILEQIAPAMLNKLLERLPPLLSEGIDYKATKDAMQKAQEESRHLWQFVRDALALRYKLAVASTSRICGSYCKNGMWRRVRWKLRLATRDVRTS
jgi:phage/plasmid-associated DNA primase